MEQLTLKYRPLNLDDLVGQENIVTIFKAMLTKYFAGEVELPAGFLFSGSRGVGKTTMARILSRLLNCQNRVELQACGTCQSCVDIQRGVDVNVIEMDAASHGLIDDIRTLKDVAMTSHSGNFRVFVLDEVHGMSNAAFQALLKVLEEPPPNTLFILATTEPHKVPETVVSRVMSFEYRRIPAEVIVKQLKMIATAENIELEDEAAEAIARYVDGGLRDAIMALDQLRYLEGNVTAQQFKALYGIVDTSFYCEILAAIIENRIPDALQLLSEIIARNVDTVRVVDGLLEYLRDMLVAKYTEAQVLLADRISDAQILGMINVLWDIRTKVRLTGSNNKVMLDMALVMMVKSLGKVTPVTAQPTQKLTKDALANMFS